MAAFDKELTKRIKASLESGDLKDQARRMNEMISGVTVFVQNLEQAKAQVENLSSIQSEHQRLKRQSDRSEEEEQRLQELDSDLDELMSLKNEYDKSKNEVRDLSSSVSKLNSLLRKF